MVQLYLSLTARPGHAADVAHALRLAAPLIQAQNPDVQVAVCVEVGKPEAIRYTEDWPLTADLDRRIRSAAFRRLLAIMETADAPPTLEFRFISETRGLDYVAELCMHPTCSNPGDRP